MHGERNAVDEQGEPGGFGAQVQSCFAFLIDLGFVIARETSSPIELVRYESADGVFVEVYRIDEREHFTGLKVGLVAEPADALSDSELRRLEGAPSSVPTFPLSRPRDVVSSLAWLLSEYGERVLRGDQEILEQARALRRGLMEPSMRRSSE